eukprot:TRINITY_DN4030_c0_g1_i1.p1 TRINITY_DN4030_c0_g1~~TRINITY_DN4030_c0_g1_i1.p1  ORF type:complete len:867 (-),score=256.52 TRINITY_DN4030_c0_g1_i1:1470-3713(-)
MYFVRSVSGNDITVMNEEDEDVNELGGHEEESKKGKKGKIKKVVNLVKSEKSKPLERTPTREKKSKISRSLLVSELVESALKVINADLSALKRTQFKQELTALFNSHFNEIFLYFQEHKLKKETYTIERILRIPLKMKNLELSHLDPQKVQLTKNFLDNNLHFIKVLYEMVDFHNGHNKEKNINRDWRKELYGHYSLAVESLISIDTLLAREIPEFGDKSALYGIWSRIQNGLVTDYKGVCYIFDHKVMSQGRNSIYAKKKLLGTFQMSGKRIYYSMKTLSSVLWNLNNLEHDYCGYYLLLSAIGTWNEIYVSTLGDMETLSTVISNTKKEEPSNKPQKKDINIWEEPEVILPDEIDKEDFYCPGTLNNIIRRLSVVNSDENIDNFINIFLLSFNEFCKPEKLWKKLKELYEIPPGKETPENCKIIKQRVTKFVTKWIYQDLVVLDVELLKDIFQFAKTDPLLTESISQQFKTRKEELLVASMPISHKFNFTTSFPDLLSIKSHLFILHADEGEIAEQLTWVDKEYFDMIEDREYFSCKWNSKKHQMFVKNIVAMISRSDQLSHWVATSIIVPETLEDRHGVLRKMIYIALALYNLNNFNSMMAILTGLNMACVARLRQTFAQLSKSDSETLKDLMQHQEPTNSFGFLRSVMEKQEHIIPYLGVFLSDLSIAYEGKPTKLVLDNGTKVINFAKYRNVSTKLTKLVGFQGGLFNVAIREPLFSFLFELTHLKEEELYQLSLEREPREH